MYWFYAFDPLCRSDTWWDLLYLFIIPYYDFIWMILAGWSITRGGYYGPFVTIYVYWTVVLINYIVSEEAKSPRPDCGYLFDSTVILYGMPALRATLSASFSTFTLLYHFLPHLSWNIHTQLWVGAVVVAMALPMFFYATAELTVAMMTAVALTNVAYIVYTMYILKTARRDFSTFTMFVLVALPFLIDWSLYFTKTYTWFQIYISTLFGCTLSIVFFGSFVYAMQYIKTIKR